MLPLSLHCPLQINSLFEHNISKKMGFFFCSMESFHRLAERCFMQVMHMLKSAVALLPKSSFEEVLHVDSRRCRKIWVQKCFVGDLLLFRNFFGEENSRKCRKKWEQQTLNGGPYFLLIFIREGRRERVKNHHRGASYLAGVEKETHGKNIGEKSVSTQSFFPGKPH